MAQWDDTKRILPENINGGYEWQKGDNNSVVMVNTANTNALYAAKTSLEAKNAAQNAVPEAPKDGKQYARQDAEWSEVVDGGAIVPEKNGIVKAENGELKSTGILNNDDFLFLAYEPNKMINLVSYNTLLMSNQMIYGIIYQTSLGLDDRIASLHSSASNSSGGYGSRSEVLAQSDGNLDIFADNNINQTAEYYKASAGTYRVESPNKPEFNDTYFATMDDIGDLQSVINAIRRV